MSKTSQAEQARQASGNEGGGLLAVSQFERCFIADSPRLRAELRFQVLALVLVPLALGFAIYRVAITLLGYSPVAAAGLAVTASIALFGLDRHYLIQARGSASEDVRRAMLKVRALSILVITMAFALMVTDTFAPDIDRVLAEAKREQRAALERSPRYQAEIEAARSALSQAQDMAEQADALHARAARLETQRSQALKNLKDEVEGNVVDGVKRVAGAGPIARGHRSAAEQLERDAEAARQELQALGDVSERVTAAKARLTDVDRRIDVETELAYGGATQRLDALVPLLQASLSAWIAMGFWIIVGMLPDLLMYAAQRRMFNHDAFAAMRAAEQEDLQAKIATMRRELRQRHTERLAPVAARLAAVSADPLRRPQGASAETASPATQQNESTGGRV